MLSKLRYFEDNTDFDLNVAKQRVNLNGLAHCLNVEPGEIRPVEGGTLGLCYLVRLNEGVSFLKTHIDMRGQQNLIKEKAILSGLYGDQIEVRCIDTGEEESRRLWLSMRQLVSSAVEKPPCQMLRMSKALQHALSGLPVTQTVPAQDNIYSILRHGNAALKNLEQQRLINGSLAQRLNSCFLLLEDQIGQYPLCICHGDLGPQNIMNNGANCIVIDWEDAFWGVEGYDYLYWLTFVQNRKYYTQKVLGCTPLGYNLEKSIIALIVALKSDLAVKRNLHLNYKISVQERLLEILSLC